MENGKHEKLWKLFERPQNVDMQSLERAFAHHLEYDVGKYKLNTTQADIYQALALTIRDTLIDRYNDTQEYYKEIKAKRVYYLSLEFLIGKLLDSNLVNLGMREITRDTMADFGFSLNEIAAYEPDAGLGNGGLGRLAACFIDSLATLDLPGYGCGLRYEFGIFNQQIIDGYQKEAPDTWLSRGNPWEVQRSDIAYPVGFYGNTEVHIDATGESVVRWNPGETIIAQAFDILVPGFNTRTVNNLRLWASRSSSEFNFDYFNHGDYMRAVEDKQRSESISKVLYPNENVIQGKELRLKQQYLLVSATIQDALHLFLQEEQGNFDRLPERVFFQMNDTHPSLSVAELMRILIDDYAIPWNKAWDLTRQCLAYTNHTVMQEALERWDIEMFGRLLPRHLEIIYMINFNFMEELKAKGLSAEKLRNLSIIEEGPPKKVRMANLAIVGSKAVNGVAELHSEILKKDLFKDFYELYPEKFQNKTNGITPRRWIVSSNPDLTTLISKKIGKEWMLDLSRLREIEKYANDPDFQNDWESIKKKNKEELAHLINFECGVKVDPDSIFDVQIKRLHEYKRQLLNLLRVIGDYQKMKANPSIQYTPRTVIFAGKAAPGYYRAKLIIKLINSVAHRINEDHDVAGRLKVVFLPNYCVSLGEKIFPASNLSEQISTAGTEASGTGNMKFMLNGAITIGTLDGANIEIVEEAGQENAYIFGRTVEEIDAIRRVGYNPVGIYSNNIEIKHILDAIRGNYFCPESPGLFEEIFYSLTFGGDQYYLLEDYPLYVAAQERVSQDFLEKRLWTKKSIMNTARSGKFSSDRTILEYARDIWDLKPVKQRPPRVKTV